MGAPLFITIVTFLDTITTGRVVGYTGISGGFVLIFNATITTIFPLFTDPGILRPVMRTGA